VIVAGHTNKPNALGVWPGQDASGAYVKKCIAFADDNGWTRAEVCTYWSQIAIALELESWRSRAVAENSAWFLVLSSLQKFGEPD
jgi:hypothetical protein